MSSPQPDLPNKPNAACFSETVWGALTTLTGSFSAYGLGFNKRLVFGQDGGPALYTRGDVMNSLGSTIPSSLEPFLKPFDPDGTWLNEPSNFLYEREWRVPHDFTFSFTDIKFILVNSLADAEALLREFRLIPERIIVMDSHRVVVNTWGRE